jgi:hypothetical protein
MDDETLKAITEVLEEKIEKNASKIGRSILDIEAGKERSDLSEAWDGLRSQDTELSELIGYTKALRWVLSYIRDK